MNHSLFLRQEERIPFGGWWDTTDGRVDTAVAPAQWGHTSAQYSCTVDQIITGVDQIESLNFTPASAPGGFDPRKSKAIFVGEQLKLHQDIVWAKSYFKARPHNFHF